MEGSATDTTGGTMQTRTVAAPAPHPNSSVAFEPIDLHDAAQRAELLRQRILSGWNNTPAHIDVWQRAADAGEVFLFWIVVPDELASALEPSSPPSPTPVSAPTSASAPARWRGHVGLENECQPPERDLARPDRSLLEITSLFVLAEHRGGGLGRAAMEGMERWARAAPYGSPACRAVTIHTASRRYVEDDGEAWRPLWARCFGTAVADKGAGRSNEDWYARMGYVKWKEEPRYVVQLPEGGEHKIVAVFMKKQLV
jgi:GNAT superfamily N-acetyltransferase